MKLITGDIPIRLRINHKIIVAESWILKFQNIHFVAQKLLLFLQLFQVLYHLTALCSFYTISIVHSGFQCKLVVEIIFQCLGKECSMRSCLCCWYYNIEKWLIWIQARNSSFPPKWMNVCGPWESRWDVGLTVWTKKKNSQKSELC